VYNERKEESMELEAGKRYKKVIIKGTPAVAAAEDTIDWVEDPKGMHLAKRGPMGSGIGLLYLNVNHNGMLPTNPETGKPYADEGFTPDE